MRRTFLKNTVLAVAALSLSTLVYAGEALDRVMNKGVLKVATDANWAPQSFLNDNNEMDGFDVNVAQEVAKRLGVKVEFITPDWAIITAGKWAGRWDVSVGSMTPTKDRAKVLAFPACITTHRPAPRCIKIPVFKRRPNYPARLSVRRRNRLINTTWRKLWR